MKTKKVLKNLIYPFITVLVIIAVWSIEAKRQGTSLILPTPKETCIELINCLSQKQFYVSFASTVLRVFVSFLLAFGAATVFGVLAYSFKPLAKLLYPLVAVMRVVPTMSIILLAVIWFKSDKSPVFISFIVIFPLLYVAVLSAFEKTDKGLVEMMQIYKISQKDKFFRFYIPALFNGIFNDVVGILSFNVKLVIAGEALAYTKSSIGQMMSVARANLETGRLFAYTLFAVLFSFVIEIILRLIRRIIVKAVRK